MSAPFLTVTVEGQTEILRSLRRMDPTRRVSILRTWLLQSALVVQREAQDQIIRGGSAPPHPTRLTSRTGTGRRSITVDRTGVPRFIEIGPKGVAEKYMSLHERGGVVRRVSRAGTAHSATYPARPYLKPGLEKSRGKIRDIFVRTWARAVRTA